MKIVIMGASVSAQSTHHQTGQITGYSEVIRLRHQQDLGTSDIHRITYAGNRLSDGGLIRLQEVLAAKPDICLFEPLIEDMTRGERATDDEILYVYASLVEAGILPVTVMLPLPQKRKPELHPAAKRFSTFCTQNNLPMIWVDLTNIGTLEGRFQGIHTQNAGARIYATQIVEALKKLPAPQDCLTQVKKLPSVADLSVSVRPVNLPEGIDLANFHFQLRPGGKDGGVVRLIQMQDIGPFSPVLEMTAQKLAIRSGKPLRNVKKTTQMNSIWDPYCHYTRRSFVTLARVEIDGKNPVSVQVKQSAADPDYASCRREGVSWPKPAERKLAPLGKMFLVSDMPVEIEKISQGLK